jgi:hypothetical protein
MNETEIKQPSLEEKFRENIKTWDDIPKVFSDKQKSISEE